MQVMSTKVGWSEILEESVREEPGAVGRCPLLRMYCLMSADTDGGGGGGGGQGIVAGEEEEMKMPSSVSPKPPPLPPS
jgi:hypothetical protein